MVSRTPSLKSWGCHWPGCWPKKRMQYCKGEATWIAVAQKTLHSWIFTFGFLLLEDMEGEEGECGGGSQEPADWASPPTFLHQELHEGCDVNRGQSLYSREAWEHCWEGPTKMANQTPVQAAECLEPGWWWRTRAARSTCVTKQYSVVSVNWLWITVSDEDSGNILWILLVIYYVNLVYQDTISLPWDMIPEYHIPTLRYGTRIPYSCLEVWYQNTISLLRDILSRYFQDMLSCWRFFMDVFVARTLSCCIFLWIFLLFLQLILDLIARTQCCLVVFSPAK